MEVVGATTRVADLLRADPPVEVVYRVRLARDETKSFSSAELNDRMDTPSMFRLKTLLCTDEFYF